MKKLNKLTFPLLALSSTLMLSSMALAAEDKKTEAAPAAAPAATAPDLVAQPAAFIIPDPVATVNGASISKAAFDQYAQQLRGKAKVDSAEASKSLVDQLVLEELLVQEANVRRHIECVLEEEAGSAEKTQNQASINEIGESCSGR